MKTLTKYSDKDFVVVEICSEKFCLLKFDMIEFVDVEFLDFDVLDFDICNLRGKGFDPL